MEDICDTSTAINHVMKSRKLKKKLTTEKKNNKKQKYPPHKKKDLQNRTIIMLTVYLSND